MKLNMCDLNKIDLRNNKHNPNCNIAFIHVHKWYNTEKSQFILQRLEDNKDIKIVDDPGIWKVTAYKQWNDKWLDD